MEVRFRTTKAQFKFLVGQSWQSGVVGLTKNKATYNNIMQVVQDQVNFLPRARLPPVKPGILKNRGVPQHLG